MGRHSLTEVCVIVVSVSLQLLLLLLLLPPLIMMLMMMMMMMMFTVALACFALRVPLPMLSHVVTLSPPPVTACGACGSPPWS